MQFRKNTSRETQRIKPSHTLRCQPGNRPAEQAGWWPGILVGQRTEGKEKPRARARGPSCGKNHAGRRQAGMETATPSAMAAASATSEAVNGILAVIR